jgi:hypothetical protein
VSFIDISKKHYNTIILGDHKQKKEKKKINSPGWIGHQHGLPLNETLWTTGLGYQHRRLYTQLTTKETKKTNKTTAPPTGRPQASNEPLEGGPPLKEEQRGRHHRAERVTAMQDPTPQCCCTEIDRLIA